MKLKNTKVMKTNIVIHTTFHSDIFRMTTVVVLCGRTPLAIAQTITIVVEDIRCTENIIEPNWLTNCSSSIVYVNITIRMKIILILSYTLKNIMSHTVLSVCCK